VVEIRTGYLPNKTFNVNGAPAFTVVVVLRATAFRHGQWRNSTQLVAGLDFHNDGGGRREEWGAFLIQQVEKAENATNFKVEVQKYHPSYAYA
jgi:hypothetical protein